MRRAFAGVVLYLLLALPAARRGLEGLMVAHMLVQITLQAAAGALMAAALPATLVDRIAAWNRRGLSGILMALIVSSWWMVPRALDLALAEPGVEALKFVSLPILVGLPLAISWPQAGGMGQAFVIANVLPMWAVVGWLYVAAPIRVCNFYLVEQQVTAGAALLWVSAGLAGLSMLAAFRVHSARDPGAAFH
jgi:hypothetical protein